LATAGKTSNLLQVALKQNSHLVVEMSNTGVQVSLQVAGRFLLQDTDYRDSGHGSAHDTGGRSNIPGRPKGPDEAANAGRDGHADMGLFFLRDFNAIRLRLG
jgi:hypothetical protein